MWGKRRQSSWYSLSGSQLANTLASLEQTALTLGYTGHEQDDEVGLINMKGRLYDPEMGRFISADPHVQAAGDTQSYNRYSYVKNNPLSYTDPSGYFFKKLFRSIGKFFKEWGRTILAVAVTAFIPGIGGAFISSMIASGGDLQQGIVGALSAGVFGFIGSSFGPTARLSIAGRTAKVLAHGVAGGAMSVLRGGKFKEGFVSAGFSQVMEVTGGYRRLGVSSAPRGAAGFAKNAAISAVVGGTASKLVGGKFANGAITGAFSRMFNDLHMIKFNYKIPTLLKKAYEAVSGKEMLATGGAVGVVFSKPSLSFTNGKGEFDIGFRGEYDLGAILEVDLDGVNVGYGSADFSLTKSSATSIEKAAGFSAELNGHYGLFGGAVGANDKLDVFHAEVSIGGGYNAGYTATVSSVYSLRHGRSFTW